MRARLTIWVMLASLLFGCGTAPRGRLPADCSGVPGDFHTPDTSLRPGDATHGPGTQGRPVELEAVARPPSRNSVIPLLYIYGPQGEYVVDTHPYAKLLKDPAFVQVRKEAYWGEVVDSSYYQVPWLDKCSQAAMLGRDVSFVAPPKGILFMQFVPPSCAECDRLTKAIDDFTQQNPAMLVRWVRVIVPRSIGALGE